MSDLPISLDHCVIHVSNWDVATDFYARVLGAEVVPVDGGFAFRIGNQQLNCHGPGKTPEPVAQKPVQPGNSDLCFCWDGPIEDAVEHLWDEEVKIELGPCKRFGAGDEGTSVYFRDPDGSLLEFISYEL